MSALLERLMPHLVAAPILLPMLTAAVMLFINEGQRPLKSALSTGSALLGLGLAASLLYWTSTHGPAVYLPGNWTPPFGIVLVVDRLSALMLLLTSTIGVSSVLFASARWDKAGVLFHPLSQLQLMGLAGAFLTGDLFNLFVFFEILLAASYGLLLHGSGRPRVGAGLHYVAINLVASSLFLIGASMLYGITGTLNLADLSVRVAQVAETDRSLLHAAASILGVAFLAKAAMWPLNFWLVPAYSAATAPVGGIFAILTKVGVYAVLRTWTLLFSASAGPSAEFGGPWLIGAGLVTVCLAAVGMMGSQRLGFLAGFSVIVSAGTLVAAIGFGQRALTGGALYYLVSSTLTASAFLLLIDLVDRWRNAGTTPVDLAPFLTASLDEENEVNLDDDEKRLVGRPIPAPTAFLGFAFLTCSLLVMGLPPLSGFVGKVAMLRAALGEDGEAVSPAAWAFLTALIGSGLLSLVAMSRAGIRYFWTAELLDLPKVRMAESIPVTVMLGACVGLTVGAEPVLRFTQASADALLSPAPYIEAVFAAQPVAHAPKSPGGAP